ncbi:MAG: type II toxin-antitoxin system HicB family antitoxin [Clostridia bacterium]|nr:type II toxin-antitoxin system HicB family antitoxin [Clostridia bacterium]
MSVKCTVVIQKEDSWYVATDVATGVASQGKTLDESIDNLKEALSLYFEDNTPTLSETSIFVTTMEVAI